MSMPHGFIMIINNTQYVLLKISNTYYHHIRGYSYYNAVSTGNNRKLVTGNIDSSTFL